MNVRLLESDVLFAFLPAEPQAQPELRLLWRHLAEEGPLHLIVDMSRVEIITSPSIGSLLLLRKLQAEQGVRLLLCNVRLATKCILRVVGLETIFDYADDKLDALKILRHGQGLSAASDMGSSSCDEACDAPWPDASGRKRLPESSNMSI
jgi:anti-anti-sigma factor